MYRCLSAIQSILGLPSVCAAVGQHVEEMQQGLEDMAQHLGHESPLIAAALRWALGRAVPLLYRACEHY